MTTKRVLISALGGIVMVTVAWLLLLAYLTAKLGESLVRLL